MENLALFLGIAVVLGLYFVPTGIALMRKHHNTLAIIALNTFLGWTLLGWIASLVWSLTAKSTPVTNAS